MLRVQPGALPVQSLVQKHQPLKRPSWFEVIGVDKKLKTNNIKTNKRGH